MTFIVGGWEGRGCIYRRLNSDNFKEVNVNLKFRTEQIGIYRRCCAHEARKIIIESAVLDVVDICTEYEGGSPYPDMSVQELIPMLEGGYCMPKPNHVSEKLYAIMLECWNEQPENRPTFSWICFAVKRLLDDVQVYVNLEGYDNREYLVMI